MISREAAFAESLQRIRRIAREQGNCISREQVEEEFSDLELNEIQLGMVYDYLEKHHVGIGLPANPEEGLTEEEMDYLQNYLDSLEALPVYSDGERRAYTMSALAGDRKAAGRLTESYLKDVADIAKLYAGQGILLEDLIGEGNAALAMGVELLVTGTAVHAGMLSDTGPIGKNGGKLTGGEELFQGKSALGGGSVSADPSEAESMLVRSIMDAMEVLIRENEDTKKEDKKIAGKVNEVADRARELAKELHRKVTPEELMQETGIPLSAIRDAMRVSGFQIEDIEYAEDGL